MKERLLISFANLIIQYKRQESKLKIKTTKYIIIDDKFLGIANAPCFMVKYK